MGILASRILTKQHATDLEPGELAGFHNERDVLERGRPLPSACSQRPARTLPTGLGQVGEQVVGTGF